MRGLGIEGLVKRFEDEIHFGERIGLIGPNGSGKTHLIRLDIDSSEALEAALEGFTGTVVAVSHDRAFLRGLDRFLMLDQDGSLYGIPDAEAALDVLAEPERAGHAPLVKRLSGA